MTKKKPFAINEIKKKLTIKSWNFWRLLNHFSHRPCCVLVHLKKKIARNCIICNKINTPLKTYVNRKHRGISINLWLPITAPITVHRYTRKCHQQRDCCGGGATAAAAADTQRFNAFVGPPPIRPCSFIWKYSRRRPVRTHYNILAAPLIWSENALLPLSLPSNLDTLQCNVMARGDECTVISWYDKIKTFVTNKC